MTVKGNKVFSFTSGYFFSRSFAMPKTERPINGIV